MRTWKLGGGEWNMRAVETRRVADSDGALCLECGDAWDLNHPAPWGWRKSQKMHEKGTGHDTAMFRYVEILP